MQSSLLAGKASCCNQLPQEIMSHTCTDQLLAAVYLDMLLQNLLLGLLHVHADSGPFASPLVLHSAGVRGPYNSSAQYVRACCLHHTCCHCILQNSMTHSLRPRLLSAWEFSGAWWRAAAAPSPQLRNAINTSQTCTRSHPTQDLTGEPYSSLTCKQLVQFSSLLSLICLHLASRGRSRVQLLCSEALTYPRACGRKPLHAPVLYQRCLVRQ